MNLTSSLQLVAMFAVGFVALEAAAQPTADKPDLKVGDKWVFNQTVKVVPGEEKSDTWSRRVAEIQPDGRIQLATGKDEMLAFDAMLNRIDQRGPEYSFPTYKFPMKIGSEWSYSARTGEGGMLERRGSYKVVAYEPVTVPAGTFDCFHVEGQWDNSTKSYSGRAREQYWYCPAIKFIAKSSFQYDQTWGGRPSRSETRLSELTKFTPAP
jgi:hypothetical protein